MKVSVTKMYLKEDGQTLVLETMLWEGTPRKHVIRISDILRHEDPKSVFEIILSYDNSGGHLEDHIPISVNGYTYLVYRDGFCNCEKGVYKAILNGFPIDTQQKTELTDDLLTGDLAY